MKTPLPDFLRNIRFEYKVTLIYLIFGFLWILFSDEVLDILVVNDSLLTQYQTYKGTFFIAVTTVFLYLLVKGHMQNLRILESRRIESESHYRALFFDNLSILLLIDPETGKIEEANQAACDYYGWTRSELCLKSIYEIDKADPTLIRAQIKRASSETKFQFESRHRLSSGEFKDVEVFSGPILLVNRTGLYFLIHDITEIKRQEGQLFESEFRFSQLYANGPFGMVIADGEFRFVKANSAFCSIMGYTEPEIRELTFKEVTHPEDMHNDLPYIEKLINKELDVYKTEKRYIRKDGQLIWGSLTVMPTYDKEGNFLYNLGIVEDITWRKAAEEELRHSKEDLEKRVIERTSQLEAANQEMEAFTYSVSHDLMTPLRHINGYAGLLNEELQDNLPGETRHYLENITITSKQMSTLIDDLLRFSRTNRQDLHTIRLDTNVLVREVIEMMEPDIRNRNINWSVETLPEVFGDDALLHQVWINLIGNAVKYTRFKELAEISIGCREEKDFMVFCICDNGVGFDMQYAHKLFGVFQRLHSQREFEGTGIGLANVQRIVNRHNGRVWAESEPNKGASFYFSLPYPPRS
ncbi:MAG: sensor histidine kinase [Bacteroidales bacterium]